jgi:hypothetical protein
VEATKPDRATIIGFLKDALSAGPVLIRELQARATTAGGQAHLAGQKRRRIAMAKTQQALDAYGHPRQERPHYVSSILMEISRPNGAAI